MRGGIPIGKLFGIEMRLHYSWFIIFALITWALAASYFPANFRGWTSNIAILAGIITSLLFFGSVMAHELMHSIVAQKAGIPVQSITLFIFGGVSQMSEEPKKAGDEFKMAFAGPLTSAVLGGIFWIIFFSLGGGLIYPGSNNILPFMPDPNFAGITRAVSSQFVAAVTFWLGLINLSLAVFNLIPGFPLDGGRVFRSIIWGINNNLRRATRVAATVGRAFGFLFIFGGIYMIFFTRGGWLNGLWIAFIGWFLENAATGSYQQVALQDILRGHRASEIMTQDCQMVPPDISVEQLVNQHLLTTGRRCFPVVQGERVLGLVTLHNVRVVPHELWGQKKVSEVMTPFEKLKSVSPDEELINVMRILGEENINQVPVVQGHTILGMVARDNLISFVNVRSELSRQ